MNRITFPPLSFSRVLSNRQRWFLIAEVDGRVGVVSRSGGRKTASFWIVSGCGVPLFLVQRFPAIHKIYFSIYPQKFPVYNKPPYLFGLFVFRFERRIL